MELSDWFTIILDAITCPINIILFIVCCSLIYFFCRSKPRGSVSKLPKLHKRDFTLDELNFYDGNDPEKRILIAVNGKVFDVTNNGQEYYGKNAPYALFAGRDASRALACFTTDKSCIKSGYDDLSDLSEPEMNRLIEWELQFTDRYDHVGQLLRPGEPHHVYETGDELDIDSDYLVKNKKNV